MALAISCLTEMLDCLPNNLFVITSTLGEIISTEVHPLGESVLVHTLFSALYTKLIEMAENDAANRGNEMQALSKSSICSTLAEAICSIDEDNKHTEGIHNLVERAQTYVNAVESNTHDKYYHEHGETSNSNTHFTNTATNSQNNSEFVIDASDNVPDILCGDLLKTFVGKQCVKVNLLLVFQFETKKKKLD